MSSSRPLLGGQGNLWRRRGRKVVRTRGGKWIQGKIFQILQGQCTYDLRLCQHIQDLYKFKSGETPARRRGNGQKTPLPVRKLFVIDSSWEMGNQFSSREHRWVWKPYSRTGLVLRSSWSAYNGLCRGWGRLLFTYGLEFCFLGAGVGILFWGCCHIGFSVFWKRT